uniref:Uncharacterized protein n=1 Tax=Phaeomonas parva TaxID=124430 RepID=A0A7S1UIJ0_9STRA|mmetsp:Transcript_6902/g.20117  ORF Transcript_6902/g.20117 Transcript_6902/m.20117 type:complete len:120 (+) Transcript_6902:183-542(+)
MKCRPPKLVHVVFTLMPFLLLIFLLNERRRLYESLPQHEIGEGKANLLPGQHSGYETIRSRLVGAPSSLPWEETSHGGATRKATLIGQGEVRRNQLLGAFACLAPSDPSCTPPPPFFFF